MPAGVDADDDIVSVDEAEAPGVSDRIEELKDGSGAWLTDGEIVADRETLPEKPKLSRVTSEVPLLPASQLAGEAVEAETSKSGVTTIVSVTLWLTEPVDPIIVSV